MKIFMYVMIGIYFVLDLFLMKRYENKISELTDENKELKKKLEESVN